MNRLTLGQLSGSDVTVYRLREAGMSVAEAKAKKLRFSQAAAALIRSGHAADSPAVAAFVPGRIEVFGKHTDYCGGRSLLCTVERGMCFVAVRRADDRVRFHATDVNEAAELSQDRPPDTGGGHWSHYPASVVRRLSRNFPASPIGADVAMSSDLPKASGLSSSSAFIVGTFLVLARIGGVEATESYRRYLPDRESLAGYLGTVENGQSFGPFQGDTGVGTFGGSQDHTAILGSRVGKLSVYSFCPVRHQRDVPLSSDVEFVIADSGIVAEKTGEALQKYNRVSARARELVSLWNDDGGHAGCLNDIVTAGAVALARLREVVRLKKVEEASDLMLRLDQFLIESNNLIPKAADMVEDGDWRSLRWIADESHGRAASCLFNQVPETNRLQRELVRNGAFAASAFGAGFGGSVWGLFDRPAIERWRASDAAGEFPWFSSRPGGPAIVL